MDPFEHKLRKLPWRSAPDSLRERIFTPAVPQVIEHSFRLRRFLGVAAVLLISATFSTYFMLRQPDSATSPVVLVHSESFESDLTAAQNFFDLSDRPEDAWAGGLTLTVGSNK